MKKIVDTTDPAWRENREKEWLLVLGFNFWPRKPLKHDIKGMEDRKAYFMGDSLPNFSGLKNKDAKNMFHYAEHSPHQSVENFKEWITAFYESVDDDQIMKSFPRAIFSNLCHSSVRWTGASQQWELQLFEQALELDKPDGAYFNFANGKRVYPDMVVARCAKEITNVITGTHLASEFSLSWIEHLKRGLWDLDERVFEPDLASLGPEAVYAKRGIGIRRKFDDDVYGFFLAHTARVQVMYLLHYLHHREMGIPHHLAKRDNHVLPVYQGSDGEERQHHELRQIECIRTACLDILKPESVPCMLLKMSDWLSYSPQCIKYLRDMGRGDLPSVNPEDAVKHLMDEAATDHVTQD